MIGESGVRLSGAKRQRIAIARALYYNPPVLVMNETTAALDNETETEIMNSLNNLSGDKILIMIVHRLTTLRDYDTIYSLEKDKILAFSTFDKLLGSNAESQKRANP